MKAKRILRGLGVLVGTIAALVVAAVPASAGTNTGVSYASNGDGWVKFVADGDNFFLNDTNVDGDAVWAELSWYKSGYGWHFRTLKSTDNGANTEASMTKLHPWGDIPEGALVWVRACGSVKSGTYSNSGDGYHGVVYDCGATKEGKA